MLGTDTTGPWGTLAYGGLLMRRVVLLEVEIDAMLIEWRIGRA
jgi:hypothetical protein